MDNLMDKQNLKSYLPLLVITAYAAVLSIALMHSHVDFMYRFMGFFLCTFALFKFVDLKGFMSAFKEYDLLSKAVKPYPMIYPLIELFLGLSYISYTLVWLSNYALIAVMALNACSVIYALFQKKKLMCACLGTSLKLPLTIVSLYEIVLMMGMAFYMLKF